MRPVTDEFHEPLRVFVGTDNASVVHGDGVAGVDEIHRLGRFVAVHGVSSPNGEKGHVHPYVRHLGYLVGVQHFNIGEATSMVWVIALVAVGVLTLFIRFMKKVLAAQKMH